MSNENNQEVQHGAPGESSDRGETAPGATPGQSQISMEPNAPVPAPREVGRSGGASGVEAGASCEFALNDTVLALLARGDEDYALPLHLTKGLTTLTGTVIVHDANDIAVLDTMTGGTRPCDFDRFVVAAVNGAPALAREVVRLRAELAHCRGVYEAAVEAHRSTKVEFRDLGKTFDGFRTVLEAIAASSGDVDTRPLASAILNEPAWCTLEQRNAVRDLAIALGVAPRSLVNAPAPAFPTELVREQVDISALEPEDFAPLDEDPGYRDEDRVSLKASPVITKEFAEQDAAEYVRLITSDAVPPIATRLRQIVASGGVAQLTYAVTPLVLTDAADEIERMHAIAASWDAIPERASGEARPLVVAVREYLRVRDAAVDGRAIAEARAVMAESLAIELRSEAAQPAFVNGDRVTWQGLGNPGTVLSVWARSDRATIATVKWDTGGGTYDHETKFLRHLGTADAPPNEDQPRSGEVGTHHLTPTEIAIARSEGRMRVTAHGLGFVTGHKPAPRRERAQPAYPKCGHCGVLIKGMSERCSNGGYCSPEGQPETPNASVDPHREAYERGVRAGRCYERDQIVAWMRTAPLNGPAETTYAKAIDRGAHKNAEPSPNAADYRDASRADLESRFGSTPSSGAALAEGVRVRSVALPHREGVVEEVGVRTIVAVKWDDGGRSNHAADALQAAPFTRPDQEKKQ